MADIINEIVSQQALDQVNSLKANLAELLDQFNKTAGGANAITNALRTNGDPMPAIGSANKNLSEMEKLLAKIEQQQKKLEAAQSQTNRRYQELNQETLKMNQQRREEAKYNIAAQGSYAKLDAELRKLTLQYKNLSKEQRESATTGKAMLTQIQLLETELKSMDATMGRHNRNVGNYRNETFQLSQVIREVPAFTYSASTGIMALSNNLPMLFDGFSKVAKATNEATGKINGVTGALKIFARSIFSLPNLFAIAVGIFTIFNEEIIEGVKSLNLFGHAATQAEKAQNKLNEAYKDDSVVEVIKNVTDLKEEIKLAGDKILDKNKVLKHYNETLGITIGRAKSLDEAERLLIENGDALIDVTLKKAAANLALQEAAEKALKAQQQEFQTPSEVLSGWDKFMAGLATIFQNPFSIEGTKSYENIKFIKAEELRKQAQEESDDAFEIFKQLEEEWAKKVKEFNFNVFGKDKEDKDKKKDKKIIDARIDIQKRLLEIDREGYDKIIKNDKEKTSDKLTALYGYYQDTLKIIELNRKKQLSEEDLSASQKKLINLNANQALLDAEQDYYDKRTKIQEDGNKNESKHVYDSFIEKQKILKQEQDEKLAVLDYGYTQGNVKTEAYEKKRTELQLQYTLKRLEMELAYVEDILINMNLTEEDRTKLTEKYNNIRTKIVETQVQIQKNNQKEEADEFIDNQKRKKEAAEKFAKKMKAILKELEEAQEMTQNLGSAYTDFAGIGFDREMSQIEQKTKALEDMYQKELKGIDQTSLSAEEKEKRKQRLEAETEAKRQQLDKLRIDAMKRQASFEKGANIANIITTTAVAVMKALAMTPPNPALAVAAGFAGGAQLARAIAAPLPQYAEGTDNAKGGLSIVGERGTELVIEPSGKKYLTPSQDTLVNLPKGSKVIPNNELDKYLYANPTIRRFNSTSTNNQVVNYEELRGDVKELTNVMKRKSMSVKFYGDKSFVKYEQKTRNRLW